MDDLSRTNKETPRVVQLRSPRGLSAGAGAGAGDSAKRTRAPHGRSPVMRFPGLKTLRISDANNCISRAHTAVANYVSRLMT